MAVEKWMARLAMGLVAGAAGTAAMNGYWMVLKKLPQGKQQKPAQASSEEPTTVKVARCALRQLGVRHPSSRTREMGGQAVHWGYGSLWGAAAALADEAGLSMHWGGGQLLGTGLWAFGDLWLLYQLGFARHPRDYPTETHVKALGAHLAYGVGVWAALKAMKQLEQMGRQKGFRLRRAA